MFRFDFTGPGTLILLLFLGYFFYQPRLSVRKNRLFVCLMILEITILVVDILSSRADMEYQSVPMFLTLLLNMGFFILYLAGIFSSIHSTTCTAFSG